MVTETPASIQASHFIFCCVVWRKIEFEKSSDCQRATTLLLLQVFVKFKSQGVDNLRKKTAAIKTLLLSIVEIMHGKYLLPLEILAVSVNTNTASH